MNFKRYIEDLFVSEMISNPTIFDHAITHSASYDSAIRWLVRSTPSTEALFFELALDDLTRDRVQLQLVLLKARSINAQPTMTFRRDANDES